ncbi:hypothetical protein Tco_1325757 [Tanacetum coccineum]
MSSLGAIDEGVFKGVHLHGSTSISYLFYADDAMFIGEWSDANLKVSVSGKCKGVVVKFFRSLVRAESNINTGGSNSLMEVCVAFSILMDRWICDLFMAMGSSRVKEGA